MKPDQISPSTDLSFGVQQVEFLSGKKHFGIKKYFSNFPVRVFKLKSLDKSESFKNGSDVAPLLHS